MKKSIKKIFELLGLDIKKRGIEGDFMKSLSAVLKHHNIEMVLDIGGNIGQFSQKLRVSGYENEILSFEPLSKEHLALQKNASNDHKWSVYQRCAVGAYDGQVIINIAKNSVSSSILPMLDAHRNAAKNSEYIEEEVTPIWTLDSIFKKNQIVFGNYFIKIDTQGYEAEVLDGGKESIANASGILVELSTLPLYKGQILWQQLVGRLEALGFSLWGINPGFTDSKTGRLLQFDAVFMRNN